MLCFNLKRWLRRHIFEHLNCKYLIEDLMKNTIRTEIKIKLTENKKKIMNLNHEHNPISNSVGNTLYF